jgi:hypothetical protein
MADSPSTVNLFDPVIEVEEKYGDES